MRHAWLLGWGFIVALQLQAAPPLDNAFRPWRNEAGLSIERANSQAGPSWIRASFEIDAGADQLLSILSNFELYQENFKHSLKAATVLEQGNNVGAPFARMHLVWPALKSWQFWKKQDGVVRYSVARNARGHFALSWQADAKEGDPSIGERRPQIEGYSELVPLSATKTRVIYCFYADYGPQVDDDKQQQLWQQQPQAFRQDLLSALNLN